MNHFKTLLIASGFSNYAASVYLDVSERTIRHWRAATRECPLSVLEELLPAAKNMHQFWTEKICEVEQYMKK